MKNKWYKLIKFVCFCMTSIFLIFGYFYSLQTVESEEMYSIVNSRLELLQEGDFPEDVSPSKISSFALTSQSSDVSQVISQALKERKVEIDITGYGVHRDDIKKILEYVINKNPTLFYIGRSFTYSLIGNTVQKLYMQYIYTENQILDMQKKMASAIGDMLVDIKDSMSDFEKALYVHDAIALSSEYNLLGLSNNNLSRNNYTMCGVFIDKTAVCQGYAAAYQYILEAYLGIECEMVVSDAMNHAWNIIKIGDSYFYVDITKDDPVPDILGYVSHEMFLCSEQGISANQYYGFDIVGKAKNIQYDNSDWKKVDSAILYSGDSWYCIDQKGTLYRMKAVSSNQVFTFQSEKIRNVWDITNLNWTNCKLAVSGDTLYFNTKKAVYSMKNDSSDYKVIDTWKGTGDLYGVAFRNGDLEACVKTSYNSTAYHYMTNITKNVQRSIYYVTFDDGNGNTNVTVLSADSGRTVTLPTSPVRSGYQFQGWYTGKDGKGELFTAQTAVNEDTVVYAYWIPKANKTQRISLNSKTKKIILGKTYTLKPTLNPANLSVSYASSNKKVAVVNKKGKITAKNIGTCMITVTSKTNSAIRSKISITVIPKAPTRVNITQKSRKAVISWKKQSDITGIEVFRSVNKASGYKNVKEVKGAKQNTLTFNNVLKGKKYYYKIRTYKIVNRKKIYSSFCAPIKIMIK